MAATKNETRTCPECIQPLTPIGRFWICPLHGQVSPATSTGPMRIFLSYGHDDNEELVVRIKNDLECRGHDVWFDKTEIRSGDDWRRRITEGIVKSRRVLSFLSKHSTRDPGVCLEEIAIAIGVKGGNIQTILVESESEARPPASISHIQWLDMQSWKEKRAAGEAIWNEWYNDKFLEICRIVESDESRRFAGEIEKLNQLLKPISSDSRIASLFRKGFTGRNWLFERIDQWCMESDKQSRLFWIVGNPGVGKSAFSAVLTHYGRDKVLAAQFVEWDKPDHRDAGRVVRSIAFQLATRLPDYRKLLLTLTETDKLDKKDPSELFDYLLTQPLRSVIHGNRTRYLIVIDALDEAGDVDGNPLVDTLARDASQLPDWIGLVVTSRPESAVNTPLQGLNPFILDTNAEANLDDIREYLHHELASQLAMRLDADVVIEKILEKSEGVFLYVERLCHDIRDGRFSLDELNQFPQGLGGIFYEFFQRQFPDLNRFRNNVRPMLRSILAARAPLPLELLQSIYNHKDEELSELAHTLGSLFPVSMNANVIRPYHKSIADWLTDSQRAGPYYVETAVGHRSVGNTAYDNISAQDQSVASDAATHFCAKHLLYHLSKAGEWEKVVACIAEPDVFQNIWPASYGIGFWHTRHEALFSNLWPRSHALPLFSDGEDDVDVDAFTPTTLDHVTGELRDTLPWSLAEAFAARASDLQLRAFAISQPHGGANKRGRKTLRETSEFLEYRDLTYTFANLAKLAPAFALSNCQFENIGSHEGKPIFAPRAREYASKARRFIEKHEAISSYVRYLADFGRSDGWSGALEDEAWGAKGKWDTLRLLAYGPQATKSDRFIKMSDAGFPIDRDVKIETPWGDVQEKPAGEDAYLVDLSSTEGEEHFCIVEMSEDGSPFGFSVAVETETKPITMMSRSWIAILSVISMLLLALGWIFYTGAFGTNILSLRAMEFIKLFEP